MNRTRIESKCIFYNKLNMERVGNILFSVGIALEVLVMMTDHFASWTIPYRGRITHVAFGLFCFKILSTKYHVKQWMIIIILGITGVVSYFVCHDEYIVRAVVLAVAAYNNDGERNLNIILYGSIVGTLFIIGMAMFGVCGNVADVRHYGRGMVEARYCLGFNHANNLHDTLWYILCLIVIKNKTKLNVWQCTALQLANIILYYFTRSRTGVIVCSIVILAVQLGKRFENSRLINNIVMIIGLGVATLEIVLTRYVANNIVYGTRFLGEVDKLLTNRLEMVFETSSIYAHPEQWGMFTRIEGVPSVDNGIFELVCGYGYIGVLLVLLLFLYCTVTFYREYDIILNIIQITAMMVLFLESTYVLNVSLLCNIFLVVLMYAFSKNYKRKAREV